MDRRSVLRGGFAASLLPSVAGAATIQHANGDVEFGLTGLNLVYPRQNCAQWCWAASVETIFAMWGYDLRQEVLVDFIKGRDATGRLVCQGASDAEMLLAIRQRFIDNNGRRFRGDYFHALTRNQAPGNGFWWHVLRTELEMNRPLLAAYNNGPNTGHAVVVTAIRLRNYPYNPQVISITVRDPWPGNPNRRYLSLQEAENLAFVAAVAARPI